MYQAIVTEARGGIVDRVLSIWELAGGDAFALLLDPHAGQRRMDRVRLKGRHRTRYGLLHRPMFLSMEEGKRRGKHGIMREAPLPPGQGGGARLMRGGTCASSLAIEPSSHALEFRSSIPMVYQPQTSPRLRNFAHHAGLSRCCARSQPQVVRRSARTVLRGRGICTCEAQNTPMSSATSLPWTATFGDQCIALPCPLLVRASMLALIMTIVHFGD